MAVSSVEVRACDRCGKKGSRSVRPREDAKKVLVAIYVKMLAKEEAPDPEPKDVRAPDYCTPCNKTALRLGKRLLGEEGL